MFRIIIFVSMLGLVLMLSGCATPSGRDYGKGDPGSIEHWNYVARDCNIESANLAGDDFKARRIFYKQCMARHGYDKNDNYVGSSYAVEQTPSSSAPETTSTSTTTTPSSVENRLNELRRFEH